MGAKLMNHPTVKNPLNPSFGWLNHVRHINVTAGPDFSSGAKDNAFIYINAYSEQYHLPSALADGCSSMYLIRPHKISCKTQIFFRPKGISFANCNKHDRLLWFHNYFLLLGMTDVHPIEIRSYNMSRIKGKNTKPEMFALTRQLKQTAKYIAFISSTAYSELYPLPLALANGLEACFLSAAPKYYSRL